jgi:hypothetical protein
MVGFFGMSSSPKSTQGKKAKNRQHKFLLTHAYQRIAGSLVPLLNKPIASSVSHLLDESEVGFLGVLVAADTSEAARDGKRSVASDNIDLMLVGMRHMEQRGSVDMALNANINSTLAAMVTHRSRLNGSDNTLGKLQGVLLNDMERIVENDETAVVSHDILP